MFPEAYLDLSPIAFQATSLSLLQSHIPCLILTELLNSFLMGYVLPSPGPLHMLFAL